MIDLLRWAPLKDDGDVDYEKWADSILAVVQTPPEELDHQQRSFLV